MWQNIVVSHRKEATQEVYWNVIKATDGHSLHQHNQQPWPLPCNVRPTQGKLSHGAFTVIRNTETDSSTVAIIQFWHFLLMCHIGCVCWVVLWCAFGIWGCLLVTWEPSNSARPVDHARVKLENLRHQRTYCTQKLSQKLRVCLATWWLTAWTPRMHKWCIINSITYFSDRKPIVLCTRCGGIRFCYVS